MPKRLDEKKIEELVRLWNKRVPIRKITRELGISMAAAYRWLKKLNLPARHKSLSYWRNFENVRRELTEVIEQIGHFPTRKELEKHGRHFLIRAISYHGGLLVVAEKLGYKPKVIRWTPEKVEKAYIELKKQLGRQPTSREFSKKYGSALSFIYRGRIPGIKSWREFVKHMGGEPLRHPYQKEEKTTALKKYYTTSLPYIKIPPSASKYWVYDFSLIKEFLKKYVGSYFSQQDLLDKGIHPKKLPILMKRLEKFAYKFGNYWIIDENLAAQLMLLKEPEEEKREKIGWVWKEPKAYQPEDIISSGIESYVERKSEPRGKRHYTLKESEGKAPPIFKLLKGNKLTQEEKELVYNSKTVTSTLELFKNLERELTEPIVDLGCGPTSPVLRATDKHVVCVDKSKEYLQFLKEKNKGKNADYIQADARYLPFKNIPTITMTYLLDGMKREDVFNILVEAKKVLNDDGKIYIEVYAHRDELKNLETLLKLLEYDYRVRVWKTNFSDGSSSRSYLIRIPSYTEEEIRHDFVSFFGREVVFLKEGVSIDNLPKKVRIGEIENLVNKPEYKVDEALKFMCEVYDNFQKEGKVSIGEILKKYGVNDLSIGPYKVTEEGVQIHSSPEEKFWVALAAFFVITVGKNFGNKYWKKIEPLLEAYKKLRSKN